MKNYIIRKDSRYYADSQQWKNEFIQNGKIRRAVYKDPDSCSEMFYRDLVFFLNSKEKNVENLNGKYSYSFSQNPFGIEVKDNKGDILFYLKSDQLGFSAFGRIYTRYIKEGRKKEKAMNDVSEWIYESRSIGGSFLWPMEKTGAGKWDTNPQYNKTRGRFRIQDRADLTLLDIRNCYCGDKKAWLWKQYNKRGHMKTWLDHFGKGEEGFTKYVEFFCFCPFLINDVPKDLSKENETPLKSFEDDEHKKRFGEYTFEEISIVLKNLNKWIKERSDCMENIISEESVSNCKIYTR